MVYYMEWGAQKAFQVAERKKDIRGYHQLEELNFQPGVTYLSKIERKDIKFSLGFI